jgi:hypothetical protein
VGAFQLKNKNHGIFPRGCCGENEMVKLRRMGRDSGCHIFHPATSKADMGLLCQVSFFCPVPPAVYAIKEHNLPSHVK